MSEEMRDAPAESTPLAGDPAQNAQAAAEADAAAAVEIDGAIPSPETNAAPGEPGDAIPSPETNAAPGEPGVAILSPEADAAPGEPGDAADSSASIPSPAAALPETPAPEAPAPKEKSRKRVLAGFGIRTVCFALILFTVLAYGVYVLTPKHEYGICPMLNLYLQPRNTVDVLVIGSSVAYTGVNTNLLWEEYGLACYNLCSAEMPFWSTYYQLREALRYQRPKLILLDAKAAVYTREYSMKARTILSTYGILHPDNRIGAIMACQKTPELAMNFIWAYPEVHKNYKSIKWEDFLLPPTNNGRGSNWKGYIETDGVESHDFPYVSRSSTKTKVNERQIEYVRKIFELAQEENIPLKLIAFPNPGYGDDLLFYRGLWKVAEEYGIEWTDYNDNILNSKLDYFTDFADYQHLNVKGSMKFSKGLGQDLLKEFDLPDRRGDPAYASYETCAETWYSKIESFQSKPAKNEPGL